MSKHLSASPGLITVGPAPFQQDKQQHLPVRPPPTVSISERRHHAKKAKETMLLPGLAAPTSGAFQFLAQLEADCTVSRRRAGPDGIDTLQRLVRPSPLVGPFHGSNGATGGTASAEATPPLSSPALFAPTVFSNPSTSSLSSFGGARPSSHRNSFSSVSVSEYGAPTLDDHRLSWGRGGKYRTRWTSHDGDESMPLGAVEPRTTVRMRSHTEGSTSLGSLRPGSSLGDPYGSAWPSARHHLHQRHLSEGRVRRHTDYPSVSSPEAPRSSHHRSGSYSNFSAFVPTTPYSPVHSRNLARKSAGSLSRVPDEDESQPCAAPDSEGVGLGLRTANSNGWTGPDDWYTTTDSVPSGMMSRMRRRSGGVATVAAKGASIAKRKGLGLLRRAGSFDVASVGARTWSAAWGGAKPRNRSSSVSSEAVIYDLRDGKRHSSLTSLSVDKYEGFPSIRQTRSSSSGSSSYRWDRFRSPWIQDCSTAADSPLRSPVPTMSEWERGAEPVSRTESPRHVFYRFSQIAEAEDEDPDRTDRSLGEGGVTAATSFASPSVRPESTAEPVAAAATVGDREANRTSSHPIGGRVGGDAAGAREEVTVHLGIHHPGKLTSERRPSSTRRMSLAKKSYVALLDLLNPPPPRNKAPAAPQLPASAFHSAANGHSGGSSYHARSGSGDAAAGRSMANGSRGAPAGGGGGGAGGGGMNSGTGGPPGGGGGGGGNGPNRGRKASGRNSPPVNQVYRRLELVGRGAYGAVYRGVHVATGAAVALKVVNLDTPEDDVSDIQREVALLSQLREADQKNVVRYWGCWLKGPELWIVMDFAEGGSVRTLMKAGPVAEKFCALIVRETLVALAYLHKSGIIHRDVKAANILLTNSGRILLCDFGVAASLASNSNQSKRSTFVGTPYWMAPEVITEGKTYDQKADVWSLGITIYEMATGNPPLADVEQMRVIMMIPKSKPPRLPAEGDFSPSMRDFVACCLNEEPKERLTSEELTKHKWMKSCAKQPVSLLKDLIQQYNAWTKAGGMRMSLIGAETADWGDAGNRDSFAFDGHENGDHWEFNTLRSARDLQEAEDEEDTVAPQPIRDHPLLRLFDAEPASNSAPGGATQPMPTRNIQTLGSRPTPPAEPAPQVVTLRQPKPQSINLPDTPKQEPHLNVAAATTASKTAGAQDKASFVGNGATPFRFGAGGGSSSGFGITNGNQSGSNNSAVAPLKLVSPPPSTVAGQSSWESADNDTLRVLSAAVDEGAIPDPQKQPGPDVATPVATAEPRDRPSPPAPALAMARLHDGSMAGVRPGISIPSPSSAISPGPGSSFLPGQQRYPGANSNAALVMMAHRRQSHGGSDPTLPSSHAIHGRNLQSLWEGGPDTSAYGRLRKLRGGDWEGGLMSGGSGHPGAGGEGPSSISLAMHSRSNGSGDHNSVVDRAAAGWNSSNPREPALGPPIRPLDFAALGSKEDVHSELARTVDDLGRWLDVLSLGLARAVKVDGLS
ncbi:kinase that interacts with cdc31p [Thecaphora frezii]